MRVAKRLKAARLEAGVLQEEAAAHLAVAYQQIHNYEKSRDRITSGKLAILAEVYGKPVQWFFEGAPKPLKNGGLSKERRDIAAEFMLWVAPPSHDEVSSLGLGKSPMSIAHTGSPAIYSPRPPH